MTKDEFRATARPVSEETWAAIQREDVSDGHPREAFTEYADGYVAHEAEGRWYPHAWWYKPVAKATREEAEDTLYAWYQELSQ